MCTHMCVCVCMLGMLHDSRAIQHVMTYDKNFIYMYVRIMASLMYVYMCTCVCACVCVYVCVLLTILRMRAFCTSNIILYWQCV